MCAIRSYDRKFQTNTYLLESSSLRRVAYGMYLCADIVQTGPPEAAMLQYVMHLLAVEDIEGLPPGGGINAK